eukprot:283882-Chlamydomonas_euryale.AAC.1
MGSSSPSASGGWCRCGSPRLLELRAFRPQDLQGSSVFGRKLLGKEGFHDVGSALQSGSDNSGAVIFFRLPVAGPATSAYQKINSRSEQPGFGGRITDVHAVTNAPRCRPGCHRRCGKLMPNPRPTLTSEIKMSPG